jgi:DNA topoisomerase IA
MQTKTLVIAEKPSVALDIVRALTPKSGKFEKHDEYHENEHYVVSSAVGHLVEIAAPEGVDPKRGQVELRQPAGDPVALRPAADRQEQVAAQTRWSS